MKAEAEELNEPTSRDQPVHTCLSLIPKETLLLCAEQREETKKSPWKVVLFATQSLTDSKVPEGALSSASVQQPHHAIGGHSCVCQALRPSSFAGSRPRALYLGLEGALRTSGEAETEGDFLVVGQPFPPGAITRGPFAD